MPDPSFKSSVLVLVLASACTASHGVPAALDAVESRAEDTFDNALAGDFTAAADNVVQLRAEWTSYRSRAVGDGATPTTLEAVDAAVAILADRVATGDRVVATRAINAVSAPMSSLYQLYAPVVPVAVLDLDYLGREMLIDALSADPALPPPHLQAIAATWGPLRVTLVGRGEQAAATGFDAVVAQLRAAVEGHDAAALEIAAKAELEAVDALETAFARGQEQPD